MRLTSSSRNHYPEGSECVCAHFESPSVYPSEKVPEDSFTCLLGFQVDVLNIHSLLALSGLVVQYYRGNRLVLQGLTKNNATWHSAFSVLVSPAQLYHNFWPRFDNIRESDWISAGSMKWLEAEDIGKYRLSIFARLEREQMDAASKRIQNVLLYDTIDEM